MNIQALQPKPCHPRSGFTLIELVMVVAIMVILLSLTIPAMVSVTTGKDIDKAVDIAESAASMARQQAVTRGTMVALLLSPASAASISNPQEFVLLQASVSSSGTATWAGNSAAIRLPADVSLTPLSRNGTSSFYTIPSSNPPPSGVSLPLSVGTQSLVNYSYIVFYSDGSVLSQTSGPAINLQRITKSGTGVDYMVLIPEASGRAKINAMQ